MGQQRVVSHEIKPEELRPVVIKELGRLVLKDPDVPEKGWKFEGQQDKPTYGVGWPE